MQRLVFSLMLVWFSAVAAHAADKSAYVGHYWNEEKDGIFKLHLVEDSIEGVTVWGKEPRTDANNPDPTLRGRSLGGIVFLWGFEYSAKKNRWNDGKVYDPDSGKTYDAKMSLEKGGQILKMRGFLGLSMFGRTAKFERVTKDNAPKEILALIP